MNNILNLKFSIFLFLVSTLVVIGCDIGPSNESSVNTSGNAADLTTYGVPESQGSYVVFNQRLIEGISDTPVDIQDVDAVFWHVFSSLPDEIIVYPTENYYYYKLYMDGKQFWGNIRLPAGRRDRGVLSFAYFEFKESPLKTGSRLERWKYYTKADGLLVEKINKFTYSVEYNNKKVIFHFNQISQDPPNLFPVAENEFFVQRTFDESGYQFFLLFNAQKNYFLWVLNEEEIVPDILEPLTDDLVVGKRSGFAFWIDTANGGRKILVAIRGQSAVRNDYYDGPFDQLADNYVDEIPISEYMQRASPSLIGRIDKYGYFTDRESGRVSISPYYVYFTFEALNRFLSVAKSTEDPYYFISRGRLPTSQ